MVDVGCVGVVGARPARCPPSVVSVGVVVGVVVGEVVAVVASVDVVVARVT